ncbi:MAG: hypothetical protein GC156_12400 [Actinomycetales bacterium]|nr:hypothetical protein [Actinomycetales bacterium]
MARIHRIPVSRPARVRTVEPDERVDWRRAVPLVLAETFGLGILSVLLWVFDANNSVLAPYLVPPLVSFVLVFATAHSPASRPLRVLVAYTIAATMGLAIGAIPAPRVVTAIVAAAVTLLLMHLLGAFHAPAVAAALIAAFISHTWATALATLPLLVGLAVLVLALVWVTHRLLGDQQYPNKWW